MKFKEKKELNSIIVKPTDSINLAIRKLEKNERKILFIAKKKKLLGVFQDSDLRRALVKKKDLSKKIISIANNRPKYIIKKNLKKTNFNKFFHSYRNYIGIPILDEKKKIVDVIFNKNLFFNNEKKKNSQISALIMAGGLGKRLMPLTKKIPKPMVKYKKKPIIDSIIKNLIKNKINKIFISVNYKKNKIISYIKKKNFNCQIFFIREKKYLGTIGSIFYLKDKKLKDIFVTNGDVILNVDLESLHDYHNENNLDITVVTKMINFQIPYGLVKTKNIYLKSLEEKPIFSESVLVGAYIINSKCLKILKNSKLDMPDFLSMCIKKKYKLGYYPIYEKYKHITSIRDLN